MRWNRVGAIGLVLVGTLVGACSTTPQSRVDKHPELFAEFTPEVREKILAGEVDIGFSPEMVYLAVGEPDRKTTQTTRDGITENWVYLTHRTRMYDAEPAWSPIYDWYYSPRRMAYVRMRSMPRFITYSEESARMIVQFRAGEVIAIEEIQQN